MDICTELCTGPRKGCILSVKLPGKNRTNESKNFLFICFTNSNLFFVFTYIIILLRELREARLAALSPKENFSPGLKSTKMGSLPRARKRLVGRNTARSLSYGCSGYAA